MITSNVFYFWDCFWCLLCEWLNQVITSYGRTPTRLNPYFLLFLIIYVCVCARNQTNFSSLYMFQRF